MPSIELPNHWKLVVGADGSEPARQALDWAVDMANAFDAEVIVVHAVGLLESAHLQKPDGDAREPLTAVQQRVDESLARLTTAERPPVRLRMEPGNPVDALLHVALEEAAQLIVVGRRGKGEPFQRALGSTSAAVASRATIPVVVVPSS